MEFNILVASGFVLTIVSILVGFMQLNKKVEETGYWRGKVETKLEAHDEALAAHCSLLHDHDTWIQRHTGETSARGSL